jgi:hypothetical protein
MQYQENQELFQQVVSAETRLREKLQSVDIKSLCITEYNQRKWEKKLKNLSGSLSTYGYLLRLSFSNCSIPIQKSVFVDYGGGCGILSFLAKELGVGTVIYNDIYEGSCNDVKLFSNALELPLEYIVCGDVDKLIEYIRKNSIIVNSIASYDVLEHLYDVEYHFNLLLSLSNPHFRLVYASGANNENPMKVHKLKKIHINAEYKNREEKWGHKETDSSRAYFDVRKDIISNYAPDLRPDQVEKLSRATRGLIKLDIEKAVDEYRNRGEIAYRNNHPTNTCDPYTGSWCEQLISIKWLQDILKKSGFSVKILSGYNNRQVSLPKNIMVYILNTLIRLLGRRGLFIAPYYIVIADCHIE